MRQRHAPLLVAFADDAKGQAGAVDRANLKSHGLADAQAAGVENRKAGLVDRTFYTAEQPADLLIGQDIGEALLRRQTNLFLTNSGQSRPRVW